MQMTDHSITENAAAPSNNDGSRPVILRRYKRRLSSPSWLARAAAVGLSSVSIGFVLIFVLIIEQGGELTLITRPISMQIALGLPYLVAVLTVATACGAVLAWWNRYWSLVARIQQTVLALLGIAFVRQLHALGFLIG